MPATRPHLGQGLQLGKGLRQRPKCRVAPRARTYSWDSRHRAGIFPSFLVLAACLLAGFNLLSDPWQTPASSVSWLFQS